MPPAHQEAIASLLISIGVAGAAILLLILLQRDRRQRSADLSPADVAHFARQDVRRVLGTVVMFLLAAGIYFGSRIPPGTKGHPNAWFLRVWLGVFVLIFFLLFLGILDLFATRVYAQRHREAITRERIEMLRDELMRRTYPTNGKQGPSQPADTPPS